jgi:hypothetical protein
MNQATISTQPILEETAAAATAAATAAANNACTEEEHDATKTIILNVTVLDTSGSMKSGLIVGSDKDGNPVTYAQASHGLVNVNSEYVYINGLNLFMSEQNAALHEDNMEYRYTLITFSGKDNINVANTHNFISAFTPIPHHYGRPGGQTALHDAIQFADVVMMRQKRNLTMNYPKAIIKQIFVVQTDGLDNDSIKATVENTKATIDRIEKQEGICYYLGASLDAMLDQKKMGFNSTTAMKCDLTNARTCANTARAISASATRYLHGENPELTKRERESSVSTPMHGGGGGGGGKVQFKIPARVPARVQMRRAQTVGLSSPAVIQPACGFPKVTEFVIPPFKNINYKVPDENG